MGTKKLFTLLLIFICIIFQNFNAFSSEVISSFNVNDTIRLSQKWILEERGFNEDFVSGPGYEILKEKYDTSDFMKIFIGEDETYGAEEIPTSIVVAPVNARYGYSAGEYKEIGRDRAIDRKLNAMQRIENKAAEKAEREAAKASEEDDISYKNGDKKVKISIWVDKDHPNNPTKGTNYSKSFTIYTDLDTLGDAMREAGLTSDTGFIETIYDINGSYTIENGISGWKGYSWMLYEGGKQTSVGADELKIKNGTSVKWKAELIDMTW